MMAKFYIVWNAAKNEGFATDDLIDANRAMQGTTGSGSTLGVAFAEAYEDDECTVETLDTDELSTLRAQLSEMRIERDRAVAAIAWRGMDEFPPRTEFGPLVDYPQFYAVDEATCIAYDHDEGEAIGLVRARLNQEKHQWEPYAWQPIPRWNPAASTSQDSGTPDTESGDKS